MHYTPTKVENIKRGELVKRKETAKKLYIRGEYDRYGSKYQLTDYEDMNHTICVKKGTLLFTDWITNEDEL